MVSGQTLPGTFDRIMIIMFENQPNILTMLFPYFKELAKHQGSHLTDYHAVTHPSQPNYISMIAGDYFGYHTDGILDLNRPIEHGWRRGPDSARQMDGGDE